MVFPVLLGGGGRLFGERSDKKLLELVDTNSVGDGVAILSCGPVRDAAERPDGSDREAALSRARIQERV